MKAAPTKTTKLQPLMLLGADLSEYSPGMQQLLLGLLAFVAISAAALAQEYAIKSLNFKHTMVFTATIPFATAAFGAGFGGLSGRKAPLPLHLLCGVLGYATFEFSNLSPIYNNYPTHTMCKSAKILPTIAIGMLVLGKQYAPLEYLAAALLVAGLAVFLQADAAATPNFEPAGIGIIGLALLCDAVMSNVQERMFKKHGCSQNEMAAYTMGTAFACSAIVGISFGSYMDGFAEAFGSAPVFLCIFAFAVGNYLTTLVIFTMLGRFGAASTVFTTSVCKAGSMALSFLVMPKAFTLWHMVGVLLVGGGVYANLVARRDKEKEKDGSLRPPAGVAGSPAMLESELVKMKMPSAAGRGTLLGPPVQPGLPSSSPTRRQWKSSSAPSFDAKATQSGGIGSSGIAEDEDEDEDEDAMTEDPVDIRSAATTGAEGQQVGSSGRTLPIRRWLLKQLELQEGLDAGTVDSRESEFKPNANFGGFPSESKGVLRSIVGADRPPAYLSTQARTHSSRGTIPGLASKSVRFPESSLPTEFRRMLPDRLPISEVSSNGSGQREPRGQLRQLRLDDVAQRMPRLVLAGRASPMRHQRTGRSQTRPQAVSRECPLSSGQPISSPLRRVSQPAEPGSRESDTRLAGWHGSTHRPSPSLAGPRPSSQGAHRARSLQATPQRGKHTRRIRLANDAGRLQTSAALVESCIPPNISIPGSPGLPSKRTGGEQWPGTPELESGGLVALTPYSPQPTNHDLAQRSDCLGGLEGQSIASIDPGRSGGGTVEVQHRSVRDGLGRGSFSTHHSLQGSKYNDPLSGSAVSPVRVPVGAAAIAGSSSLTALRAGAARDPTGPTGAGAARDPTGPTGAGAARDLTGPTGDKARQYQGADSVGRSATASRKPNRPYARSHRTQRAIQFMPCTAARSAQQVYGPKWGAVRKLPSQVAVRRSDQALARGNGSSGGGGVLDTWRGRSRASQSGVEVQQPEIRTRQATFTSGHHGSRHAQEQAHGSYQWSQTRQSSSSPHSQSGSLAAAEGHGSSQLQVNGNGKYTSRPAPHQQSSLASPASNGVHPEPGLGTSRAILSTDFNSADSPVQQTGRRFSMQSWTPLTQDPNRGKGEADQQDTIRIDNTTSSKHWRGHGDSPQRRGERSAGRQRNDTRPAASLPGDRQDSHAASSGGSMEGAAILGMRASRGARGRGRRQGGSAATRTEDRVQSASASAVPRVQSAAHGRRINPKIRLELHLDPDEERRSDDKAARPHTVSVFRQNTRGRGAALPGGLKPVRLAGLELDPWGGTWREQEMTEITMMRQRGDSRSRVSSALVGAAGEGAPVGAYDPADTSSPTSFHVNLAGKWVG